MTSQDGDAAAERAAQEARDAALATAEAAEREAAAAQADIDAASARLRDAQARAAAVRAAAAPHRDDVSDQVSDDGLDDALLHQEAKVILNLHTQAIAVQNIRTLVPLLLDVTSPFFTRWKTSFLNVLGKYSLESHVLSDTVNPASPS
jgi:hypothetical protein